MQEFLSITERQEPISFYLPSGSIPTLSSESFLPFASHLSEPRVQRPLPAPSLAPLFEDIFIATGRVCNLDLVLALIPDFMQAFSNAYFFIMRENGPLPVTWRNYLGILVGVSLFGTKAVSHVYVSSVCRQVVNFAATIS